MNIIIIANGLFPSGAWVSPLLEEADKIVCCDGALEKYLDWLRLHPHAAVHQPAVTVVGDGDSMPFQLPDLARNQGLDVTFVRIAEQDDNDLTKATRHVLSNVDYGEQEGCHVDYIGATGLREDHTLGNISLLAWYMEQFPKVSFRMLSDQGMFLPMQGHQIFQSHPGQQVSLFSLTPHQPVTVEGLRWPINNRQLEWWWEGTLNEATGDSFEVWGGRLVVYLLAQA